jgi:hypothetical protein
VEQCWQAVHKHRNSWLVQHQHRSYAHDG